MKKTETKTEIDQTDTQILRTLQEDSRLSLRKIASKMGTSVAKASSRIQSLQDRGIVKGYSALLDSAKMGYGLTAIILLQVEVGYLKNLAVELSQRANVVAVYEVAGDFDVAAVVKLKDRVGLDLLVNDLLVVPHVRKASTYVCAHVSKEDFRVEI